MKKVLITGATGFIGKACLSALQQEELDIHAVSTHHISERIHGVTWHQLDLHDYASVKQILSLIKPTYLLHLAWYIEHGLYWSSNENFKWVASSLNLVQEFTNNGGKRLVCAGTCAEYDWGLNCSSKKLREDTTPINPGTLYGSCKASLYEALEIFAKTKGISFAWGRLFFPYGTGENPKRLIPSTVLSLLQNKAIVCNNPELQRDFIFVEDRPRFGSQLITAEDVIRSTIGTLTNWIISPVMYRSEYKESGFDMSLGIYADLDYWARILNYGNLFYIDEILFNYRVHPGSETSRMLNDIEFVISLLRIAERYPKYLCTQNEPDNIHKPVMEKLMALAEYATNYLKLNYDSVLKPLDKDETKLTTNELLDHKSQNLAPQELQDLHEDLHDYKRIGYLALLQAVEQKKELDWLCEQYNYLLEQAHNGNEQLSYSKAEKAYLDRENIHNYMRALTTARAENEALQRRIDELATQLDSIFTSQSWKITAPLRMMKKTIPSTR